MVDLPAFSSREPLKIHHLSHDLRGPLSSILGFTELLLEGIEGPINEIQAEDIGAIQQSAKSLLQVVNNVVDLSKLEDDQLKPTFEPVRLDEVIDGILNSDRLQVAAEQVEVVVQVPVSLPPVWGDPDRVEQMVLNLVRFACDLAPQGRVDINVAHNEKDALVRIATTGNLSPEDDLEALFDLTVEIDAAGRSTLGAGGLDLPLVRRLAQKHGGQAWAESQEEAGTILFLQLPTSSAA